MSLRRYISYALAGAAALSIAPTAANAQRVDRIVAFGDSLVAGYGAPPASSIPSVLSGLLGAPVDEVVRCEECGRILVRTQ